jgi:hypothetical protein
VFPGSKAYAKGGKVGTKTLDEMQAELISKQGLTRRSLFGLHTQSQQYPLSKVEQEVQRIEQQAPKTAQQKVTDYWKKYEEDLAKEAIKAGRVPIVSSVQQTVQKIADTPVSRRTVLKGAAGQAMQRMLPMADVAKVLDAPTPLGALSQATQAVAPAASILTSPWAIAAKMMREGKPEKDIARAVGMDPNSFDFDYFISKLRSPENYLRSDLPEIKTPSEALNEIMELESRLPALQESKWSPFAMRPELRQLKKADPDTLRRMLNAAKDVSMASGETAADLGVDRKLVERYMRGRARYADLPEEYKMEIDALNSGYGSSRNAVWGLID